jgi:phage/plasmid-like protein (TIGR03299 family)
VTDLNAAFAAERTEQIGKILAFNEGIPGRAEAAREAAEGYRADFAQRVGDGKVRDNGDGTFTVTDPGSYDDGETLRMRQPRGFEQEQPMPMPVSNLDESRGTAALYTRVPEWHTLGTVIRAGVSDLDEVLRLAQIDFEVIKRSVRYSVDDDEIAAELARPLTKVFDGQFVTLRADTMAPLGTVGSIYTPIQNGDAGRFLQEVIATNKMVFESAGATYGGKHVFIGMRLPEDVVLDLGDGVTDVIKPYLYWLNGHDGRTSATVAVTPWRAACGNTERFALRDAVARWRTRHTTNVMGEEQVKEARRTLNLTVKYYESFKREGELLARTEVTNADFDELIKSVYELKDDDTDRKKESWNARAGVLQEMYRGESEKLGRTGYAAERAFTDYFDHVAPRKGTADGMAAARATALIEGSDDQAKTTVHKKLLTLTTR